MTSMLYTDSAMNNKLNLPGEVDPRTNDFSIRAQWRVNHWAFAAILLSAIGDLLLHYVKEAAAWPVPLRFFVALGPLLPAVLYVRSLRQWLRGMDELDRRITIQICLFAVTATFFLTIALESLGVWGLAEKGIHILDGHSWWLQAVPLTCFYLLGTMIFNRRYKGL
jgi:hypothetical protein